MLQVFQRHAGASNFEKVYFVRVSHHTSDGQFVERRDSGRVLDALAFFEPADCNYGFKCMGSHRSDLGQVAFLGLLNPEICS